MPPGTVGYTFWSANLMRYNHTISGQHISLNLDFIPQLSLGVMWMVFFGAPRCSNFFLAMAPYGNPWQDGVSERGIGILMSRARSVLMSSGLRKKFWTNVLLHVVWITNHTGTSSELFNHTSWPVMNGHNPCPLAVPFFALTGSRPILEHLCPLGTLNFVHLYRSERPPDKLSARGPECKSIGYNGTYIFQMWHSQTNKIHISSDVRFLALATAPTTANQNCPRFWTPLTNSRLSQPWPLAMTALTSPRHLPPSSRLLPPPIAIYGSNPCNGNYLILGGENRERSSISRTFHSRKRWLLENGFSLSKVAHLIPTPTLTDFFKNPDG